MYPRLDMLLLCKVIIIFSASVCSPVVPDIFCVLRVQVSSVGCRLDRFHPQAVLKIMHTKPTKRRDQTWAIWIWQQNKAISQTLQKVISRRKIQSLTGEKKKAAWIQLSIAIKSILLQTSKKMTPPCQKSSNQESNQKNKMTESLHLWSKVRCGLVSHNQNHKYSIYNTICIFRDTWNGAYRIICFSQLIN